MDRGTFTISLDFELYWGVQARRSIEAYQENLLGVYEVIPKILELFKKYEIHATWATVGFLFHKSMEEIEEHRPKDLPNYSNKDIDPYRYLDEMENLNDAFVKLHIAPKLIDKIGEYPNQEIATHTYSHFFTHETQENPEAFITDMKKAISLGAERGYTLKSLVFPRNQIDLTHINDLGIESYRGNPTHWAHRDGDKTQKSLFLRFYRLFDTYINLSGYNTFKPIPTEGVIELKSSMMLRPYLNKLSFLERLKVGRVKKAMRHGAMHGENFHLWWHPHNFGKNQEKNLKNLEEILLYFQELKTEYGMLSLTMDEVKKYVNKRE